MGAAYGSSPRLARTHVGALTHLHANSCLRVFAQGVSPPKMLSPSLSAHLHPSHPSELCVVVLGATDSRSCCLYIVFPFVFPQRPTPSLQIPQVGWAPCPCLLLMTVSNLGQVPGCPLGQSPLPGADVVWTPTQICSSALLLDFTVTR